jgi:hypothetical protein
VAFWFTLLWLSYPTLLPQPLDEGCKLLGERLVGRYCVLGLEAASDLGCNLGIRERVTERAVRA